MFKTKKGFTLIELLIVIAIIAILSGLVLAVINPQQQRNKANEAVGRSILSKACLALRSCMSASSTTPPSCPANWDGEYIGTNLNGLTLTACTNPNTTAACGTVIATTAILQDTRFLRITGLASGCSYSCELDTGVITAVTGTGCTTN